MKKITEEKGIRERFIEQLAYLLSVNRSKEKNNILSINFIRDCYLGKKSLKNESNKSLLKQGKWFKERIESWGEEECRKFYPKLEIKKYLKMYKEFKKDLKMYKEFKKESV